MDYEKLGKRIKEERNKRNLTQERLAETLHITDSYLGQIERGERHLTLDTLVDFVNYFGVTVDYLLMDSVEVTDQELQNEWLLLCNGRSLADKRLILDLAKVVIGHLDS